MKRRILAVILSVCMILGNSTYAYAAKTDSNDAAVESREESEEISEPAEATVSEQSELQEAQDSVQNEAQTSEPSEQIELQEDGEEEPTVVARGSCGGNATWTYYSNGSLKITGSGTVTSPGWSRYKSNITSAEIGEGITLITLSGAFSNCSQLTSVTLPTTLQAIGENMFRACSKLAEITLPEGITAIGDYAFRDCTSLTSIVIPESVTQIGRETFCGCTSLESVTLPDSITDVGENAFAGTPWLSSMGDFVILGGAFIKYNGSAADIIIPDGVTSIQKNAFKGNTTLTTVVLPEGLTSIGDGAFYGCSALTNVTFPDTVKTIGSSAFYNCSALTSITLPDTVETIGSSAFYNCSALTSISLPEGVTSIKASTFRGCNKLAEVTLPSALTSIGESAFYDCSALTSVSIPAGVTSIENETFRNCSSLAAVTLPERLTGIGIATFFGCSALTEISVPEGVTSIGTDIFRNCSSLTSVILPKSLTAIGNTAFRNCGALTGITIPEGVTSIGTAVFQDCSSLAAITLPESLTSIGEDAFESCSALTNISVPGGVTSIAAETFYNCSSLRSVVLPEGMTTIGSYAFAGCSNLEEIDIPDSVTNIYDQAFLNCTGLQSIIIPEGVTTLYQLFNNCTSLESVTLPDGLVTIEGGVFRGCTSLTEINIPASVTTIKWEAFYGCSSLESIEIPEGVTSISDTIFANCIGLKSITLPDSLTEIGRYSFTNCSGLESVTIPAGVTKISDGTFYGCSSFKSITIPEGVTSIGSEAFRNCSSLESLTIPGTITSISSNAFYGCTGLTSVIVCEGVTNLPGSIFEGCTGLTSVSLPGTLTNIGSYVFYSCSNLRDITIPEGVTNIGSYAFYHCTSLESITIPESVTSIGENAFEGCIGLTGITIPKNAVISSNVFEKCTNLTEVIFQDGTEAIGNSAFYNMPGLTSVTIPDSVTSIGNSAFENCTSLTEISLPKNLVSIGAEAFRNCSGFTELTIPESVTSIGEYAFYDCDGLTEIMIPESVESVGNYAFGNSDGITEIAIGANVLDKWKSVFSGSNNIKTVTIFDGVTEICDSAFNGRSGLTSIIIPDSVISIGDSAFRGCRGLTSLSIPEAVTSIGDSAFRECEGLTSFDIPAGLTSIGNSVFERCIKVTAFTIPEGVISIGDDAFKSCYSLTKITVPEGVTSLGNGAFYGCESLVEATISGQIGAIGNYTFAACEVLPELTIPDSVTSIGEYAFSSCYSLTGLELPGNIKSIGDYAFYRCGSLTSMDLPGKITRIGEGLFKECDHLVSVTIPDGVTSIGDDAFYECEALTALSIPGSVTTIGSYAFFYCKNLATANIPEGVTKIPDGLFEDCSALAEITIPDSVTEIGERAFAYCETLTEIILPDGVTSIGKNAFSNCKGITGFIIPEKVRRINDATFEGCSGLTSITIPKGVTYIGDEAFEGCSSLTGVQLPDKITSIGYYTFGGCTNLKNITLPDDVESIGIGAFVMCNSLESITIPLNVKSLGYSAFYECENLKDVVILGEITSIGTTTFQGCGNLESILIPETVTEIELSAFSGCDKLVLYVTRGSYAEQFAIDNNIPYTIITYSNSVTAHVTDASGKVPSGITVKWYSAEGDYLGTGLKLNNVAEDTEIQCVVELDEERSYLYKKPDPVTLKMSAEPQTIEIVLEEIGKVRITGTVKNEDGEAIPHATLKLEQSYDDRFVKTTTTESDETGAFSIDADQTKSALNVSAAAYFEGCYVISPESGEEEITVDVVLKDIPANRITLTLRKRIAGKSGKIQNLGDFNGLTFSAYNETKGVEITDVAVQYPYLILGEGTADPGDNVRLSLEDSNNTVTAENITVTLNEAGSADAEWTLLENGRIEIWNITGNLKKNLVMVYDAEGNFVQESAVIIDFTSKPLVQGDYTCVIVKNVEYLRKTETLERLNDFGLQENEDYMAIAVSVTNGDIVRLYDIQVPELNEEHLHYYTVQENTRFWTDRSEVVAGQYVTMRASYEIDEKYDSSQETVILKVPYGLKFVERSLTIDGKASSCTVTEGNYTRATTVTVPVNKRKGTIRFYVLPYNTSDIDKNKATITNAYLSFVNESHEAMQPIGATSVKITKASIVVPYGTGTGTFVVSGKALPNSEIMIFDESFRAEDYCVPIETTTANKNGSWSATVRLHKLKVYEHLIYAVINNKEYGISYSTDKGHIYVSSGYPTVKTVTMINTAHPAGALTPIEYKTVFDMVSRTTSSTAYSYWPQYPTFTFKVDFLNRSDKGLNSVSVITVNSAGDKTVIDCEYDSVSGCWIGTHDYTNFSDVPSKVMVKVDNSESSLSDFDVSIDAMDVTLPLTAQEKLSSELEELTKDRISEDNVAVGDDEISYDLKIDGQVAGTYQIELMDYEEFDLNKWAKSNYAKIENPEGQIAYQNFTYTDNSYTIMTAIPSEELMAKETFTTNETNWMKWIYKYSGIDWLTGEAIDAKDNALNLRYCKELYDKVDALGWLSTASAQARKDMASLSMDDWLKLYYITPIKDWVYMETDEYIGAYNEMSKKSIQDWANEFYKVGGIKGILRTTDSELDRLVNEYLSRFYFVDNHYSALMKHFSEIEKLGEDCSCIDMSEFEEDLEDYKKEIEFYRWAYTAYAVGQLTIFVTDYVGYASIFSQGIKPKKFASKLLAAGEFSGGMSEPLQRFIADVAGFDTEGKVTDIVKNDVSFGDGLKLLTDTTEIVLDGGNMRLKGGCLLIRMVLDQLHELEVIDNKMHKDYQKMDNQLTKIRQQMKSQCDCNSNQARCDCRTKGADGLNIEKIADPSGYVYEAVPSNRVEGVKAEIYAYDYAIDEFGIAADEKSEILWNAEDFDQVNPQYTDIGGTYGWDVPEGQWLVKFSKEGYEDTDSRNDPACDEDGYLPMPPIQTEVNTAIVSKAAPEVASVFAYPDEILINFSQYMQPETVTAQSVTVTSGTKKVAGTVKALNAEDNYDKTAQYASAFAFVPEEEVSGTVNVSVNGVKNYNAKAMKEAYSRTITVVPKPKSVEITGPDEIQHHTVEKMTIQVLPAEAGANRTLNITSYSPSIVSVSKETVTTDENGQATVVLRGNLPGHGILSVSLEGTDITEEVTKTVTRLEAAEPFESLKTGDYPVSLDQNNFTYDGTEKKPAVIIEGLLEGEDYMVEYKDNVDAGTATVTITGGGIYIGTVTKEFAINPASVVNAAVTGIVAKTYTGKALTQKVAVKVGDRTLESGTDFTVTYKNNVKAGKATVVITGTGNYKGSVTKTFTIKKAANTLTVKAKTAKVSYTKLKKKNQNITAKKAMTVSKAKGTVTYKLVSVTKSKFRKYFTVNAKTGKITVKKGLKKGTYKVKIKVTAAGTANYLKKYKNVTVKVTVK